MSLYRSENTPDDIPVNTNIEHNDGPHVIEMGSHEVEKNEAEYQLANETINISPRSTHSAASSSEIFSSPIGKLNTGRPRPKSARSSNVKCSVVRPSPPSSIPLPVKSSGPIKISPLLKNPRSNSRTISMIGRPNSFANKHTLEIQFINKNKRFCQMRRDLLEKQKPIMDLYHNLTQLKKRLEELGKSVKLEEVKLVYFDEYNRKLTPDITGNGEQVSLEVVNGMKCSIEEIPKTLMDICKNLLSRRALIVELLESVTKSEVDVNQVSDKIESLKREGHQLQQSLDAIIKEHEIKITELVSNWQKLLSDKQCFNMDSKIDELEARLKDEERLREESTVIIHDLHKKLEDKKNAHEKSLAELNGVLQSLRDQVKKLEQDLEGEKKTTVDFKTRNNTNSQTLKAMRNKINDLENERKDVENSNSELQKKIRLLQEQLRHKECQWTKEKEDMNKSLKHQENLLQKLTADKNQFETRLETIETTKSATEKELQTTILSLENELQSTRNQLNKVMIKRDEAVTKCSGFESYIARMGEEFKETMYRVSCSIEWGKAERQLESPAADNYMQEMAKDLRITELEDKIFCLEREQETDLKKSEDENQGIVSNEAELQLKVQKDRIKSYELLLEESENKLKHKSMEVEKLRAEIRQLKVRQEALEEQNEECASKELQQMLNEGRNKLNELMKKSVQTENEVEEYKLVIEKQRIQMNEMDNLLRYRENMANVLKSSRNDLLLEKESLARYSREARAALAEVTSQSLLKDSLINSLKEKLMLRETQLRNFETEICELEEKLQNTNQKRYKLQETVGTLEQELQKSRAKVQQIVNLKDKGGSWRLLDSVCEVIEDKKPNKNVSHYCNNLVGPEEIKLNINKYCKESSSRKPRQYSNVFPKKLRKISKASGSLHKSSEYPFSLHTSEFSSNNIFFENDSFQFTDQTSSMHTHCHHRANSRSLISLSLQTVDFIKAKLNFLTSVNTPLSENVLSDGNHNYPITETQISSTQTPHLQSAPNRNLDKIMELTAHRYEYLHNQAQDSYDDLAKLVKFAVTQKDSIRK